MSDKIHEIVHSLLDGIHMMAKSETIVGEPQQAGDAMIIPVHRLKVAFGVGSAQAGAQSEKLGGETGLMGAGGAVELDPVAAIAVGRDGTPHILTVEGHAEGTWSALLQEVPDLMVRVIHSLGDRVSTEVKDRLLSGRAQAAPEAEPAAQAAGPAAPGRQLEPPAPEEPRLERMCELLGMECNVPTDIVFSFSGLALRGGLKGPHADGWGLALYDGRAARVFLEPSAAAHSPRAVYVQQNPMKTLLAIAHVRQRTRGPVSLGNTHPFCRELWGRHWVFAHNGTVRGTRKLETGRFAPIGSTDSERAFCALLHRLQITFPGYPKKASDLWGAIAKIGGELGDGGTFNFLLGDGAHLYARCATKLHYLVRKAPFHAATLADDDVSVDFAEVTTPRDRVAVVATAPLTRDEVWTTGKPGELWVFRGGALRATLPSG
jgi:predicted glutamine amidotransferase/uncharacterized spore protein YtfJ